MTRPLPTDFNHVNIFELRVGDEIQFFPYNSRGFPRRGRIEEIQPEIVAEGGTPTHVFGFIRSLTFFKNTRPRYPFQITQDMEPARRTYREKDIPLTRLQNSASAPVPIGVRVRIANQDDLDGPPKWICGSGLIRTLVEDEKHATVFKNHELDKADRASVWAQRFFPPETVTWERAYAPNPLARGNARSSDQSPGLEQ